MLDCLALMVCASASVLVEIVFWLAAVCRSVEMVVRSFCPFSLESD